MFSVPRYGNLKHLSVINFFFRVLGVDNGEWLVLKISLSEGTYKSDILPSTVLGIFVFFSQTWLFFLLCQSLVN